MSSLHESFQHVIPRAYADEHASRSILVSLVRWLSQRLNNTGSSVRFDLRLIILGVALAFSVVTLSKIQRNGPNIKHIPVLGSELGWLGRKKEMTLNAKAFLQRGYEEFNKKDKPFQVQTTEGPMVVLNAKQSEEVGSMPEHIVDHKRPNGRFLMDEFTGYLDGDDAVLRVIKTQLSTRLGELGDILADQTDKCLAKELPSCAEWTPVQIYDRLARIVASVSTRIFAGEELTENEEWLTSTIGYTVQLVTCATILKYIPGFLRPALYRVVPAYRKLVKINTTATRLIKPIVQRRREAMEKPDFVGTDDMMQWMLNERVKKSFHDRDYQKAAQFQLQLAFAATHTTSMAVTNMLFDLVAYPQYIGILREEIQEQLDINGGSFNGPFLKNLPKLDSFMKESQRHNPVGYTIMGRDICEDIKLSDGTFLPKGTFIVSNLYHISHDPEVLRSGSDPNSFDGLRYYNMRHQMLHNGFNEKEVAGKHQFVSVSTASGMFGAGKHACPGRFFAGNEIKLILAKIVMRYDLKMPAGVTERYESRSWEVANFPATEKAIMMKKL